MIAVKIDAEQTALSVGDVVGIRDRRDGIFSPGVARWHALRVRPQREDQAEAWLSMRGVYAFHPVLMRKVRRAGKVREYARRYLPGYVFARFPGEASVHAVLTCPFVVGAVTRQGGEWGILEPQALRAIHSMRRVDAQAVTEHAAEVARRRARAALRPGDVVMFKAGVFAGFESELIELLAENGAKLRLNLFGRETMVEAGVADLMRTRKTC